MRLSSRGSPGGERWPGAHVEITSGADEHHGFVRYSRTRRDGDAVLLTGFEVGDLAPDGRLRRVIQFVGPFPLSTDALPVASLHSHLSDENT